MSAAERVLGVDLGSNKCGWGVLSGSGGKRVDSGVWTFGDRRAGIFLVHLIVAKAIELRVTRIAYEAVGHHMSASAGHMHGELRASCYQAVTILGFGQLTEVMTSTIKKVATGDGRAKKPLVIQAASEVFGVLTRLEDEAEALWVAEAALLGHGTVVPCR